MSGFAFCTNIISTIQITIGWIASKYYITARLSTSFVIWAELEFRSIAKALVWGIYHELTTTNRATYLVWTPRNNSAWEALGSKNLWTGYAWSRLRSWDSSRRAIAIDLVSGSLNGVYARISLDEIGMTSQTMVVYKITESTSLCWAENRSSDCY